MVELYSSKKSIKCVVLGVNGQDGSYLAAHLLARGYTVIGIGRQEFPKWIHSSKSYTYKSFDLHLVDAFSNYLEIERPDVVFHAAAVHGAAGFKYEEHWLAAHSVNTLLTHAVLEFFRRANPNGNLIYFSSSKAFGSELPASISEASSRKSTCIYSTTKNSATDLINYYRTKHKICSSVIWTFNHDSPRRIGEYFIPKIVNILASSILTPSYEENIATLDFWCDWGHADEYMSIIVDLYDKAVGNDFILASGSTLWAKDVVDQLFEKYGLAASDHIREILPKLHVKPNIWHANINLMKNVIGSGPKVTIQELFDELLKNNHPKAWAKINTGA